MTILQIILVALSAIMLVRQFVLVQRVNLLVRKYGGVKIAPAWWIHLVVTIALVLATIISFTGVAA